MRVQRSGNAQPRNLDHRECELTPGEENAMKGMRRRRTDHRDSEVGREKIDDGGSYADSTGFSRRMSAMRMGSPASAWGQLLYPTPAGR